ncbi:MAG: DUF2891 domain-containing protein [Crocinitomicaceae bacterium]|nr:DUF2891 domain-containing protein [Crocinitomicaceae bacterium]
MKFLAILFFLPLSIFGQAYTAGDETLKRMNEMPISYEEMEKLASLPLECVGKEYPNKLNQVLREASDLKSPKELHPIFYGCFDWHSACHGYWLLAKGMNAFPKSKLEKEVVALLNANLTADNVMKELEYFKPKLNQSFERTYGWAWLLKLHAELSNSKLNKKHKWTEKLQPLTDHIVKGYLEFLPKLVYPIRVGEHTNTAFGLTLAYEYATTVKDQELKEMIEKRAREFYLKDINCPISYEPSGFDFISPCLQEAHLMSKILTPTEFEKWMQQFMPFIFQEDFTLEPGKVLDRTDGKLVHLDGLNFSRAWGLYGIAKKVSKNKEQIQKVADQHIEASKEYVVGSDYMGSHWLASFMVYAVFEQE